MLVRAVLLTALAVIAAGAVAESAAAENPPELLWQVPTDKQPGSGAGRFDNPRAIAASPSTGNVFIADRDNSRIVEFTAWGEFVSAWGYGVLDGSPELQTCTTVCQQGTPGGAPGQIGVARAIAADAGSVYLYDSGNNRVTKYGENGEFLLMFGGEVNETTGANLCTAADLEAGDDCGPGVEGSGPGFFDSQTVGDFIDVGPSGSIYVGGTNRIQEFNPDGTFKSQITFSGDLAPLAGLSVYSLAVDPVSGDLYVSTNNNTDLFRISATGEFRGVVEDTVDVGGAPKTFPVNAAGLAVDSGGNLYVIDHRVDSPIQGPFEVLKFDPAGNCLICGSKFAQPAAGGASTLVLLGLETSDACLIPGDDLYVTVLNGAALSPESYAQSYGPAPQDVANCPPPEEPPSITEQFASSVGSDEGEVKAQINPRFWNDTTYYVQYGPQECLDSGWTSGCSTDPVPPGQLLTDKVLNQPVTSAGIVLEGLQPDTLYHYRFVAQSSGGGPVIGIGGTETEPGASSSFRTLPGSLPPQTNCPNQLFRTGFAALLPDCRAYEMVSPVDKNGGDILTQKSIRNYPAELDLSSVDGDSVTFSSEASFANAISAPYSSQYIAKRDPAKGWQTEAISPPREELFRPAGKAPLFELDNQYKLFSPDLATAWLMQEADPPLDECGVEDYINWYKRDNATGAYEAVTTKPPPPGTDPLAYISEVQGTSADGTHTVYRANAPLATDSGPAAGAVSGYQLYEHVSSPGGCGETRLVSVLPGGTASTTASSLGTATAGTAGAGWIEARENLVHNAISADGSTIYWTAAGEGAGQVYVRVEGTATFPVSSGAARFWFASEDGKTAYYTEGETLKAFDIEAGSTQIATQVLGMLGASEDGSRAYFVSKADLDGGGGATAGQPNLYLLEEGSSTFVATLSANDVSVNLRLSPASSLPASRTSSLSSDGRFLAFTSDAALTGADNTDAASGLPDTQAFLYEADSGELRCVSCNASGARPQGRILQGVNGASRGVSAQVPPWKNQFHAPRVISTDGSRVFFESLDRLVPRDTNGMQDVYMWTRAGDEAACEAIGAELYNAGAGGCISLISSGTGESDAQFVDSTPDASNVFFRTRASLVSQDPGAVDLYDARVGGGFPPPPVCEDPEGCPPPPKPPVPPGLSNSGSATGTPDFDPAVCKPLHRKASKLAAKARKLRKKAAKAEGGKARALRKQAKKMTKQAKRASAKAQACNTGGK